MKKRLLLLMIFLLIFMLIGCTTQQISQQENQTKVNEASVEKVTAVIEEIPQENKTKVITEETKQLVQEEQKFELIYPLGKKINVIDKSSCGVLYDAYTRIQGGAQDSNANEAEIISLLAARMEEHNVGCALLVSVDVTDFDTQQEIKSSIDYLHNILKLYPSKFVPLLDIDADSASDFTLELIEQILAEAKGKINFKGFGEVSFVDPGPWMNKKLTDEPLPEIIEFLGNNNLIFAAHIRDGQISELDTILSQHPNTKILVHGNPSGMKDLLAKHKNLYYAAELEIMLGDGTFGCSVSITDSKVNSAINEYASIIAAAPQQVLWATNAASKCHFQPAFYSKLIEFTELFLQKLPEEHRDEFAYKNAVNLFGTGQ